METNTDSNHGLLSRLEAVLFTHGEPIRIKKIAGLLNIDEATLLTAVSDLSAALKASERGLALVVYGDEVELVTKPEHRDLVQTLIKNEFEEELSPATQETLAIIAYTGPVSRSEIDYVRGVNSSFTVRNLLLRGLIERSAKGDDSRSPVYEISLSFLEHVGLTASNQLPDYEKYRALIKTFRAAPQS